MKTDGGPPGGWRQSLLSRFAASTAVLAALVVVLSLGFIALTHEDLLDHIVETTLSGFSLSLSEVVWREPELAGKIAERHRVGITIEGPDGTVAFRPGGDSVAIDEQVQPGKRYRLIDVAGPDGRRIAFYWDLVIFARAHVPMALGLSAVLLLLIGATYAFQVNQLRPLRWLRRGVEAVSRGDFATRVPVVRPDEIGQVAAAFNLMTHRVQQMVSDRERLLSDVSHELRSPLARIKVALELLPEDAKRDSIRRDIRQMETLISALLERGRLEAQSDRQERESVDLVALTRRVLGGFDERSPEVRFQAPVGKAELEADAALLEILVHNLVDNAVKFSPGDGPPVKVTVDANDATSGVMKLSVEDHGPGIPKAERERVFEPFVKLDPARGHSGGHGLGLDLCRRIAKAHGGGIEIEDALGDTGSAAGTRVVVRLPC